MAQINIALPDLENANLTDRRELRALRDYMYMLNEQLSYALMHLDEENLSEGVQQRISAGIEKGEAAVEAVEECRAAIEKTDEKISLKVQKGEIISEINQSAEELKIKADRISLEGLVTVNGGFKIHTDGSMQATAGSLGAFSADAAGNLAGAASLKVGGMTFSGNRAAGLKIGVDNLNYVYGRPAGSSGVYFLCVSDTGVLCLGELYFQDGQLYITEPGNAPSQSGSTNVVMVTAMGNGLIKYASPSTNSSNLGMCYAGEVYGYTGSPVSSEGLSWVHCNKKYSYNSSNALWTGVSVSAFYIPQANAAGTERYLDFTTVNT